MEIFRITFSESFLNVLLNLQDTRISPASCIFRLCHIGVRKTHFWSVNCV